MTHLFHPVICSHYDSLCHINSGQDMESNMQHIFGKFLMDKSTSVISRSLPWGTSVPTSFSTGKREWLAQPAQSHNCNWRAPFRHILHPRYREENDALLRLMFFCLCCLSQTSGDMSQTKVTQTCTSENLCIHS